MVQCEPWDVSYGAGWDQYTGYGRIDAYEALLIEVPYIPGDTNCDYTLDIIDLSHINSYVAGIESIPVCSGEPNYYRMDVNGDCTVDERDSAYLSDYIFSGGPRPRYGHCENVAPVLGALEDKEVNVGETLEFTISAFDQDSDPLTYSAHLLNGDALPEGAVLTSGVDTAVFSWTPTEEQGGLYYITFVVSDGELTDEGLVIIKANRAPVFDAIEDQVVGENDVLELTITATDPDDDTLSYTAEGLPEGAEFVDNKDNTALFSWVPDYDQEGEYKVAFIVTDGGFSITEDVLITVDHTNRAPQIGGVWHYQFAIDSELIKFVITGSDPDGDELTFSSDNLPDGATLDEQTGTFNWTPSEEQVGIHPVKFIVSDGEYSDSLEIEIYVYRDFIRGDGNCDGKVNLFDVYPIYDYLWGSGSIPQCEGGIYRLDLNGDCTVDISDHVYLVSYLYEGGPPAVPVSESCPNLAPQLETIGDKLINAGEPIEFTVSAIDKDYDDLTFELKSTNGDPVPANIDFHKNGDRFTADFSWIPTEDQEGVHELTFVVKDEADNDLEEVSFKVRVLPFVVGDATCDDLVKQDDLDYLGFYIAGLYPVPDCGGERDYYRMDVNGDCAVNGDDYYYLEAYLNGTGPEPVYGECANEAPVLHPIGDKEVNVASTLEFTITAFDQDTDPLVYSAHLANSESLPAGITITQSDNTGIFTWTPTEEQGGLYSITFVVSDGVLTDEETITIKVNRAPVFNTIEDQSVNEADTLELVISATDADADALSYTAEGLPDGAEFVDNQDNTATLTWTPDYEQSGEYTVTFTVTDGAFSITEDVLITVEHTNREPEIAMYPYQLVIDSEQLEFTVNASDPDADELVFSSDNLPEGASLDSATGLFSWIPTEEQVGIHAVTFTASDGELSASDTVEIYVYRDYIIGDGNCDGALNIGDINIIYNYLFGGYDIPQCQDGVYRLDVNGNCDITISDVVYLNQYMFAQGPPPVPRIEACPNIVPVLSPIGDKLVDSSETITFTVSATDNDFDDLEFSLQAADAGPLPEGIEFTKVDRVTANFSWTPTREQEGIHELTFAVTDSKDSDSETINLRVRVLPFVVGDANCDNQVDWRDLVYIVNYIQGSQSIPDCGGERDYYRMDVNGDCTVDTDDVYYLQAYLGGTGPKPVYGECANEAPILDGVGDKEVNVGDTLEFVVSAFDQDTDPLVYSAQLEDGEDLPEGAVLEQAEDEDIATFTWSPSYQQRGIYRVVLEVSDGEYTDEEVITIAVRNQAPELDPIGDQDVVQSHLLEFTVTATDPNGDPLVYSIINLPEGAAFTDNQDSTATFSWVPEYEQTGNYFVTIQVSDGEFIDSETFEIVVHESFE
jgi:PKD repeat protein